MSGDLVSARRLGLVCASAGGVEVVRERLIEPMVSDGWTVAVTVTPTAATRLRELGELERIEAVTGLPVRHEPRLAHEVSPHPDLDCIAVVPATANTVAKLALGIADNQALTQRGRRSAPANYPWSCSRGLKLTPVGLPGISTSQRWRRRAYASFTERMFGPCIGHEAPPGRELPWQAIREAIEQAVRGPRSNVVA